LNVLFRSSLPGTLNGSGSTSSPRTSIDSHNFDFQSALATHLVAAFFQNRPISVAALQHNKTNHAGQVFEQVFFKIPAPERRT
jgi:hypothetical protein